MRHDWVDHGYDRPERVLAVIYVGRSRVPSECHESLLRESRMVNTEDPWLGGSGGIVGRYFLSRSARNQDSHICSYDQYLDLCVPHHVRLSFLPEPVLPLSLYPLAMLNIDRTDHGGINVITRWFPASSVENVCVHVYQRFRLTRRDSAILLPTPLLA